MKAFRRWILECIAGDANANREYITAADKSLVNTDNLSAGYYNSDTNLSGIVTARR